MAVPAGAGRGCRRRLGAASVASVALIVAAVPAACLEYGYVVEVSPDGAWSWFSDPRSFYEGGSVYAGWVTKDGDVQMGCYRIADGDTMVFGLAPDFEPDDHDYPAFYQTSDGRCTAFYSYHAWSGTYTKYRTTVGCGAYDNWLPEMETGVNSAGGGGVTYANPYPAPGAIDEIYLFWRGGNWKPNYSRGTYSPDTQSWSWSPNFTLISVASGRPYVKYESWGGERIGFAFTDGHPRDVRNNIYYAAIAEDEGGTLAYFRADGSKIKDLCDGPLGPSEADTVFNRLEDPETIGDNSWVWDIAFDGDGNPVVVFATFLSRAHHQYHWTHYDGAVWKRHTVVDDAGGSVADTTVGSAQYYYSAGVALDHKDPTIVYLCRANDVGGWDLEQWKTADDGETWETFAIVKGDTADNLRPVVPINRPGDTELVLWMHGRYDYYANSGSWRWWPEGSRDINYDTSILMWINPGAAGVPGGEAYAERTCVLGPARPNPFNAGTEVSYSLAQPALVSASVYDVAGRRVAVLLDAAWRGAGQHSLRWCGTDGSGRRVAAGVYFLRVVAGERTATTKMVLLE